MATIDLREPLTGSSDQIMESEDQIFLEGRIKALYTLILQEIREIQILHPAEIWSVQAIAPWYENGDRVKDGVKTLLRTVHGYDVEIRSLKNAGPRSGEVYQVDLIR